MYRTLADLRAGARARVTALDTALPSEQAARLRALGFRVGMMVERVRTAPLGDPAVYRVCDYDICLRANQARAILVAS